MLKKLNLKTQIRVNIQADFDIQILFNIQIQNSNPIEYSNSIHNEIQTSSSNTKFKIEVLNSN